MTRGGFQAAIQAAIASGRLVLTRGRVTSITIAHEDDCAHLRGGECRCRPELIVNASGCVTVLKPGEPLESEPLN